MSANTNAVIRGISIYLPEGVNTSASLLAEYPDWEVDKIAGKTGITSRHEIGADETGIDMAEAAVRQLFDEGIVPEIGGATETIDPDSIDALLYCTQNPDYLIPANACLLQHRLSLPTSIMALDFSLGCSGYVYGLALAKGLVASGQAKRVLLVTCDYYTRYLDPDDRSTRTLFGDAATATLIDAGDEGLGGGHIGPAIYGTDGRGGPQALLTGAGMDGRPMDERSEGGRAEPTFFMDGLGIFAFTQTVVPKAMKALLEHADIEADDIDRFVFHQANKYMLEHLRRKLRIPPERFVIEIENVGNTVSGTIPIALGRSCRDGRVQAGQRVALLGFGSGFSWGGVLVDWK